MKKHPEEKRQFAAQQVGTVGTGVLVGTIIAESFKPDFSIFPFSIAVVGSIILIAVAIWFYPGGGRR